MRFVFRKWKSRCSSSRRKWKRRTTVVRSPTQPCLSFILKSEIDLHTLKDIKKLQESYERLQVRCEYLQRQVVDLESFRRSALQTQQEQQSTSNRAVAASVATPTPPVSARQPSSSSAKKRSIPEDFENHGAAPVRAIAVSSSPQKNASRPVVSLKNKNSIESKISKRPMPLGSARQPLRSEVVNKPQDLSATGVERSQSSKLRANLAALQSQHPQRV